jgi:hypothetical protein
MKREKAEQHDDHIWMIVRDDGWAIRGIERGDKTITFHLWRGYAPCLEYTSIQLHDPDWKAYCEQAVAMISERWS